MPGLLVNQVSFRSGPRWLIPAGLIALVATMAVYLFTRREELVNFQRLSITVLLLGLCLQCLSLLLWNGTVLLPLQIRMKRLGFWELFMVQTGGFLVGYLVPVAGNMAVRMTYLRRRGLHVCGFHMGDAVEQHRCPFDRGRACCFRRRDSLDG